MSEDFKYPLLICKYNMLEGFAISVGAIPTSTILILKPYFDDYYHTYHPLKDLWYE